MPILQYRDHQIPYILKPSRKRRTLALQVSGYEQVTVLAPHRLSESAIDRFLQARAGWVWEKLRYFEEMGKQYPPKSYRTGETFLIKGEAYTLEVMLDLTHRRSTVEKRDRALVVHVSAEEKSRQAVHRWYKAEAANVVQESVQRLAPLLNVFPQNIRIANQKRRWGSCSSQGHLRFNWRVAMMPAPVTDYIVIHELAHMRVPNHSSRFWRTVESIMPDYNTHRRWLRANSFQLGSHP